MNTIQQLWSYLTDPTNRTVLYGAAAAGFLLLTLLFAFAGYRRTIKAKNRSVVMRDNNQGLVITGDIVNEKSPGRAINLLLTALSTLSAVVSALFAALAYFYPPGP